MVAMSIDLVAGEYYSMDLMDDKQKTTKKTNMESGGESTQRHKLKTEVSVWERFFFVPERGSSGRVQLEGGRTYQSLYLG